MLCSAAIASANVRWRIASTGTYVRVPVTFFHSNESRRLEVSCTCLSYEGRPDWLKASDARLKFETAQRYFDSFLFTLITSPNAWCKNCGQSDNVNCQRGCRGAEVITKNLAITKFLSQKFTFMWFLAISRKFWTTKIWSYTVTYYILGSLWPFSQYDLPSYTLEKVYQIVPLHWMSQLALLRNSRWNGGLPMLT